MPLPTADDFYAEVSVAPDGLLVIIRLESGGDWWRFYYRESTGEIFELPADDDPGRVVRIATVRGTPDPESLAAELVALLVDRFAARTINPRRR